MLGIIPLIMMAVAARQLYLSKTDDLSTWKGGGMGMFAGAETTTRYTKIYLTFADGSRQPLMRLTDPQEELNQIALNYPSERNMQALAQSIRAMTWWASTTRIPLNVFDEDGQKVQDGIDQLYDLYASHPRTSSDPPPAWGVEIEYWKATYDPQTKAYIGVLARKFKFEE
jgi:hypothetical protein